MAPIPLTEGAIAFMSSHINDHMLHFKPVLQVADIRRVQNPDCERYRILLSDGEFSQQGMLATQHNELVRSNKLQRGSVVHLNHFVCNVIQCDPIGLPKPFLVEADGNAASAPGSQSVKHTQCSSTNKNSQPQTLKRPSIQLTKGSIAVLSKGDARKAGFKPVLQVDIHINNTENQNNERYRVLLSDGNCIQPGMLATQLNQSVKCKKLQKGSVIRLNEYVCNTIQSRMIIIVIDLDVILERCNPIGVPKPYPVTTEGNASVPAPRPMNVPSCCLEPGSSITVSSTGAGTRVHITVTPQNEMQITITK